MPFSSAKRPTAQLHDLLMGKVTFEQASPAIRSWAQFYFYEAAVEVIRAGDVDARRQKLGRIPENMRPHVERELKRIWPMRDDLR